MRSLIDYKETIHSCSKCGLCQSVCPVYKITGNDCTVSRGLFIMLKRYITGEVKMSKNISKYLDKCLKCNACFKFCPSDIDVVEVLSFAKAEYYKKHKTEYFKSFITDILIKSFNLLPTYLNNKNSKTFQKKVVYFGGCESKIFGNKNIIKLLNSANIEVITPNFGCCGYLFFINGDMERFKTYMKKFYSSVEKYKNYDIITSCATCEKTIKMYSKFYEGEKPDLKIKNIFEYLRENNIELELKKNSKVTFHKPCNLDNFADVKWVLGHTKNLEYTQMEYYDLCCGFNSIINSKEHKIASEILKQKHNCINNSGAKTVLTSCTACKFSLILGSCFKYKVLDFVEFLGKNLK